MRKKRLIFILVGLLIFIASTSFGVDSRIPEIKSDLYVFDEAGLISDELERYIIDKSKKISGETKTNILTTTISSLEGMEIREYSSLLFNDSDLDKEDRNGILILVAPNEDKSWIEVGPNVKTSIRDNIKNSSIEEDISSYIRVGEFDNGILLGVNKIIQEIDREYNIEIGELKELSKSVESEGFEIPWKFILVIIIIGFMDMKFFKGALFYTITLSIGFGRKGTESYDGRDKR